MTPLLANTLWFLSCVPESLAFRRACRAVARTQQGLLLRLLQRNAQSAIGQRYGFASIRTVAEYQARVPCSDYDEYEAAIQRIGAGEAGVLTADPVLLSACFQNTDLLPHHGGPAADRVALLVLRGIERLGDAEGS